MGGHKNWAKAAGGRLWWRGSVKFQHREIEDCAGVLVELWCVEEVWPGRSRGPRLAANGGITKHAGRLFSCGRRECSGGRSRVDNGEVGEGGATRERP